MQPAISLQALTSLDAPRRAIRAVLGTTKNERPIANID
ncbi:hypothetical protein PAMC26577_36980 [Caballeronia sordidicola]|uniref:Uncharacterized protein n=1 Tax=Caballeronia sordidicola TaxID=196367 RepID=A0A242M7Y6_CABSO|nr:hypothetical protein PAMC26577_36980 [Caballeronia sordidicola]